MRQSSLLFLLGSLLSSSIYADDAHEWLVRMTDAASQQSFRGTFIYERSGNFSTHRIWRQAQGPSASRERLLQLDGQEQEVLLHNGQISCASADLAEEFSDVQHLAGRKLDVSRLEKSYELKKLGNSRVAGRSTVVLLLLPRDANRYARELQLDVDVGLPLKSLLLNEHGQLLERLQYTSLFLSQPVTDKELQSATDCHVLPIKKQADAQALWNVGWVPPGFTQIGILQSPGESAARPQQSLMFDDGLARFSVFIAPLDDSMASSAHAQVGPTVVVAKPFNSIRGPFMATVVGEVPFATAERVASSVRASDMKGSTP